MTTVERVISVLTVGGYRELSKPFSVASLPFNFASTLIARERALDLIVIVDMDAEKDERRLVQNVQSLARALDVMRSRRPLTVVLVGPSPIAVTLEALKRVCRVLTVGVLTEPSADQPLRDALAVLLPLPHLDEMSALADWRSELYTQLADNEKRGLIDSLLPATDQGPEAVEKVFSARLRREIIPAIQEDHEDQD